MVLEQGKNQISQWLLFKKGADFFFWIIFFLWFQLKMERFQVGVGQSPFRQQKKLRIELKEAAGGGPPDAFPEHATWFACRVFRHGA